MYVYREAREGWFEVGFFDASGNWQVESDHKNKDKAATRTAWMNGGAIIIDFAALAQWHVQVHKRR